MLLLLDPKTHLRFGDDPDYDPVQGPDYNLYPELFLIMSRANNLLNSGDDQDNDPDQNPIAHHCGGGGLQIILDWFARLDWFYHY